MVDVYKTALHTIYPPSQMCLDRSCIRNQKKLALKKTEARQAVLFTMASGAVPVWSVHLICESEFSLNSFTLSYSPLNLFYIKTECKTNYHHNFRVSAGQRIYYTTILDIIQVGEHQFVETKVINLWITMMLLSWTSATN